MIRVHLVHEGCDALTGVEAGQIGAPAVPFSAGCVLFAFADLDGFSVRRFGSLKAQLKGRILRLHLQRLLGVLFLFAR